MTDLASARIRGGGMIAKSSELEDKFAFYWQALGDDKQPAREHRGIMSHINKQRRLIMTRHRFDFAFIYEQVAIEIEGGIYTHGRHTRGAGYAKDCQKYNKAAEQGWLVLRYTSVDIDNDPATMIEQVKTVLQQRRRIVAALQTIREDTVRRLTRATGVAA